MPSHILFVCQSCHHSSEDRPKEQPTNSTRLLEHLNTLTTEQPNKFETQPVGCLWTCDKPCAVAIAKQTIWAIGLCK
ncbi:DUF1636 family protein [Myxacorys almedinensis]|uniref:DUF1636 domain-containing protein n=1 Tax=Myxacorys almedinensis A TaxID=2690445 RepID=A0A8J7Z0H5_9CYAN|nr:DUF1636 domain-containing protein [Myxacorys almedinensis A]